MKKGTLFFPISQFLLFIPLGIHLFQVQMPFSILYLRCSFLSENKVSQQAETVTVLHILILHVQRDGKKGLSELDGNTHHRLLHYYLENK
jgi:hypothetical protein